VVTVLTAAFFVSSCATYRAPAASQTTAAEAQRATCDDFAQAEVKRLGEFVPAALARGFFIGLALDVSWATEASHVGYSAWPREPIADWPPIPATPPAGSLPLVSWAVGGSQLARDAERTNEDVYQQAIDTCMAPARLAAEFGRRDARVAIGLEMLADCYAWQHRYALAEPLRREAVAIWEGVFGAGSQRVARALDEHARLLRQLRRSEEADALSYRADAIRARVRHETSTVAVTLEHALTFSCDPPFSATLFLVCRGPSRDWTAGQP
jgi:hypothetical protein